MTTKLDHAREQAQAQLEHIIELMEWLEHAGNCDGDEDCHQGFNDDMRRSYGQDAFHSEDAATQAIHENALDVEVTHGWHEVGNVPDEAEQFYFGG